MLKNRSDALLVWVVNTDAAGGSAVVVTNSGGLYAMQSGYWVVSSTILNSGGWIVNVANTGGGVNILNSGGLFAMQSGAWAVSSTILNSAGWVVNASATILNSAGWVVSASATILNSAGWVVSASSTILNSAGWIVSVANTGGNVNVTNTGGLQIQTYDTAWAYDGITNQITMKYGTINVTNSTNTLVVNAISSKRIRVMSLMLVSQGTGLAMWQSGTSSGVGLTGPVYLGANVGYVLPFNPNGWFQTAVSTELGFNLTTPTSVGGCISYLATS